MEILLQLGANKTVFIQFFIFILSISFLTTYVYGPFFKAYDQRLGQTKGSEQVAAETQVEAKKIESIYILRAREINEKIKNIFDACKKHASDLSVVVLTQAKAAAGEATEKARKEIAAQQARAEKNVQEVSREVATELAKKLTGALK